MAARQDAGRGQGKEKVQASGGGGIPVVRFVGLCGGPDGQLVAAVVAGGVERRMCSGAGSHFFVVERQRERGTESEVGMIVGVRRSTVRSGAAGKSNYGAGGTGNRGALRCGATGN